MLSTFSIFHRGGAVLFTKQLEEDTQDVDHKKPIDNLVQNVLLEERQGLTSFSQPPYTLKWTFENSVDLVFVAVYLNLTPLFYLDDFLEKVKNEFVEMYRAEIRANSPRFPFEQRFSTLYDEFRNKELAEKMGGGRGTTQPRSFLQTEKGMELQRQKEFEEKNKKNKKTAKQKKEEEKKKRSRKKRKRRSDRKPKRKPSASLRRRKPNPPTRKSAKCQFPARVRPATLVAEAANVRLQRRSRLLLPRRSPRSVLRRRQYGQIASCRKRRRCLSTALLLRIKNSMSTI
jgi:hypothetical protein